MSNLPTSLNKALLVFLAVGAVMLAGTAWAEPNACAIPAHASRHLLAVCEQAAYPVRAAPGQQLGLDVVVALVKQGQKAQVRYCALYALGESGDPRAAGVLVALLKDPDPRARRGAAHGLGKLSCQVAVMPLIEVLCRPSECAAVRSAAAGSLGRLGDPRAVGILTYHSQNQNAWVRGQASKALARLDAARELQRAGR